MIHSSDSSVGTSNTRFITITDIKINTITSQQPPYLRYDSPAAKIKSVINVTLLLYNDRELDQHSTLKYDIFLTICIEFSSKEDILADGFFASSPPHDINALNNEWRALKSLAVSLLCCLCSDCGTVRVTRPGRRSDSHTPAAFPPP